MNNHSLHEQTTVQISRHQQNDQQTSLDQQTHTSFFKNVPLTARSNVMSKTTGTADHIKRFNTFNLCATRRNRLTSDDIKNVICVDDVACETARTRHVACRLQCSR